MKLNILHYDALVWKCLKVYCVCLYVNHHTKTTVVCLQSCFSSRFFAYGPLHCFTHKSGAHSGPPQLVSLYLKIAYRKVRSLQIGVDKLVGKVSELLDHTKSLSATYAKLLSVACIM